MDAMVTEFSARIGEIERKLNDAIRDRDNYKCKYEELGKVG